MSGRARGVLAVALVLVLAAVGAGVLWARAAQDGALATARARDDASSAARKVAVALSTLDYRHPERAVTQWHQLATGDLYDALEKAMGDRKGIKPNLDYPSGPAYNLMGFDTETFTPLFVASRIVGWTAHIMEQQASNALIRPLSAYNGVEERHLS